MNEQEYKEKVLENIKRVGWHCTAVLAGENSPPFTYTVGLFKTHGMPELLIIGLPDTLSYKLLDDMIGLLLKDELDLSVPSDIIIKNYSVFFVEIDKRHFADYIKSAIWFNDGVDFPAYQMVWPSQDGLFPWDKDATEAYRKAQPLLGIKAPIH